MKFLKKNWSNLLILIAIVLLIIPQTRLPIQVFIQRIIAFSPSEITLEEKRMIDTYEWELLSLEGNLETFKAAEESVVIVNFWATWCPPCIAEMPSFQNLYSQYEDKIQFYFVSNEKPEKLQKFLANNGYNFPVYISNNIPGFFDASSLPKTYVIDKKGEIVVEKTGVAKWDSSDFYSLLDRLLQQ